MQFKSEPQQYSRRHRKDLLDVSITTALPTGFTDSASGTYSSGYSPGSVGWNKNLLWNNISTLDQTDFQVYLTLTNATSTFSLIRKSASIAGTVAEIAVTAGAAVLKFYAMWDGGNTPPASAITKSVSFTLVAGRTYIARLRHFEALDELSITDRLTGQTEYLRTDTVSATGVQGGAQWGQPGVMFQAGSIKVTRIKFDSPFAKNCKLLMLGHSFVEGYSLWDQYNQTDSRYGALIRDNIEGETVIAGMGGATSTDILNRLTVDLDMFNPDYVIVDSISNDTNYATWLANIGTIVTRIKDKKAKPILVTATPRDDRQTFINNANTYTRGSGEDYIDSAYAVTLNNDGVTRIAANFHADDIHLSVLGNIVVFKRAQVDVPYLFIREERKIKITGRKWSNEKSIKRSVYSYSSATVQQIWAHYMEDGEISEVTFKIVSITSAAAQYATHTITGLFKKVSGTISQIGSTVNSVAYNGNIGNGTSTGVAQFTISGTYLLCEYAPDSSYSIQATGYIEIKTLAFA